ncbi:BppU family phage baseplate upper protein [Fructobacillus americanaquae]|uniref:Phage baseplate upper protein n=1 Tax=Fructobacillus americanaquae TaxID=2940302 RepID=A0ABY5BZT8_9LACO|nr:BppU family phage baseplate upper protein [Fructobacillus americanaquae]USS92044.1 phage baseplate upper protein [Fructobacillus americanaquae]
MARTYAELNTNLNTNQSTFIDQLNGRQGDANREVFFQIKDGTTPYNLEGKTIALFAKDAQGVIKATSTINDQTGISVGRFSMIIPKEFYQASGAVEDAYIQISYSDKVISTIPVSFQVIANTMLVTQTQSQMFIDTVQSLVDETNQRLSSTITSLTSVENAVEALKVTIGNLNDQYNSDLFAKNANDNEFKGVNTFDKKIVAPNGVQGKADSATQADNATHAVNADVADSAKSADVANSLNPAYSQTVNDLTVSGKIVANNDVITGGVFPV